MKTLNEHAKNVYSQFGEDGIIEKIFERIDTTSKTCIEFGAWDGLHFSNTAHLWKDQGWKAVLIESEPKRFEELFRNTKGFDCKAIHASIGKDPADCLETLLMEQGIKLTPDADLLSIDIDGDDYYVLESLKIIKPRVIICEYNPTIPAEADIYPAYGNYFGCSAAALQRVAISKGYKLIALTDTNCFFVLSELYPAFNDYETRLDHLRIDRYLTYLLSGYDGDYVLSKPSPYGVRNPTKTTFHGLEVLK